jgi:hypothetical protein
MDTLIAFYKIHYNFAALSVIVLLWALTLIMRGNRKWFLIVFISLVGYNIVIKRMVETNPKWFEEAMTKFESFDFVDYLWGGGTVTKQNEASEKRLNQ